jgi:HD-GYP domain-containing protein (c-di-GMP phosphodiesterase class II)
MTRKIHVDELQVGMFVQHIEGGWLNHPFWRGSFLIREFDDIRRLRAAGVEYVVIDSSKGLAAPRPVPAPAPPADDRDEPAPVLSRRRAAISMEAEVQRAQAFRLEAGRQMKALFQQARMGRSVDVGSARPLVDDIFLSVERHPAALISLLRLKTADDYSYLHSVSVAALMVALARQLGMEEQECRDAGLGGLLHDLGKAAIPLEVLNKPGKLEPEEFTLVKTHPVRGHELLLQGGVNHPAALDVCLHHHEKIDGSGYPKGLPGDAITQFAKMGAVCDVYDAVTSDRPYKAGWAPVEALRRMLSWAGHFEPHIMRAFVSVVGIYPVGALVRLASGRLAVVVEQSPGELTKPVVKAFFSTRSNLHIPPETLRLAQPGSKDHIVGHEDPHTWGFEHTDELWTGLQKPKAPLGV